MIYIVIATVGILYELLFVNPVRPIPILLWLGLIGISIIIILTLKDSTTDRHRT
jgi:predicted membrane channel-forming protein YqfA (hemolysin III family)